MRTDDSEASIASPECPPAEVEKPPAEFLRPLGEGLGVFRALILMLLVYLATGSILWFAWHAWRHWRAH